jgi:valyl-tRNA synthetase
VFDVALQVLSLVRKAKTEAKRSLRTPVERLLVRGTSEQLAAVEAVRADLGDAGVVQELLTEGAEALSVEVTLAPAEAG